MLREIKDIRSSLWISASAGSGKTKNLIDRILALLLNGVAPAKILCLTYTKAAASEMLLRLSNDCWRLCQLSDKELHLKLEEIGFDNSYAAIARSLYDISLSSDWVSIQTIHSFCFVILERFPLETGLFPGIKILDNYQQKQIIHEAIQAVLSQEKYANDLETIAKYTTDISRFFIDYNIARIQNFVAKCDDFIGLYYDFFNIDKNWHNLNEHEIDERLFEKIFQNCHESIFSELAEILSCGGKNDLKAAEILRKNSINPTEEFANVFLTEKKEIRSTLCTNAIKNEFCKERMLNIAQKAMEFCELKKRYVSAKSNASFFSIAKQIVHNIRKLKKSNHCLDYNDVISMASILLESNSWAMYKIDREIDHILVDEAQDTSPEQWEIIRKISDEFFNNYQSNRTIFVVGDEKQSIYSFQGADVRQFDKMHQYFRERSISCGQKFYDVFLNKSYRSTGNILSFVDKVFADTFSGVKHISNRSQTSGTVEMVDVFQDDTQNICDAMWQNAGQKLSSYLAKFIKGTIEDKVFVESKNRFARASDFLILFRHRDFATMNNVVRELRKNEVNVTGIDRVLLKNELVVEDLIVFAEFAVFPLDDLMCARCLKSPVVGITDDDLASACLERKDKTLWNYLSGNDQLFKKYSLDKLQNYINQALQLPVYDFFMYALADGLREKFIYRLGRQCLDVLNEFLDITLNYEAENNPSLQSFLIWFRSFEHEIKRESFGKEDSVRIMTVHASKGLQAPFVILADTHFSHIKGEKLLMSEEGLMFWDFSIRHRSKKISSLYENSLHMHDEESRRLLYVAITRAEDFLYILGAKHTNALDEKCWYSFIQQRTSMKKFPKNERFGTEAYVY
jgi:ATP-dependent helicase/nuclease subunit A